VVRLVIYEYMSRYSYKDKAKAGEAAGLLRILASGPRLQIVALLLGNKKGVCVFEIAEAVGLSQSATSHQLAKLTSHGIVQCDREGQTMCYKICQCDKAKSLAWVVKGLETN